MNISYSEPLSKAWLRMKTMLFRPFNIGVWFVLGFSAFLASLAESAGSSGGKTTKWINGDSNVDFYKDVLEDLSSSTWDFIETGLGLGIAMVLGIGVIVIGLLILWVSSRGQFMFLDNLVHRRTEITRPWSEFAAQGNSLFVWQIFFALITMATVVLCVLLGVGIFVPLMSAYAGWVISVPLFIVAGTIAFILIVTTLYIDFFLFSFIVPIMHRERIGAMAAWSRFLPLFREHPGSFILCGLFYTLLTMVGYLAFMLGGLLTCCIGLILMAIPYLGSVITLPLSVTLRYYTLDFLSQFGGEFIMLEPVSDLPNASTEFHHNRAVIGTEDVGEDGSGDEPGPQNSGD